MDFPSLAKACMLFTVPLLIMVASRSNCSAESVLLDCGWVNFSSALRGQFYLGANKGNQDGPDLAGMHASHPPPMFARGRHLAWLLCGKCLPKIIDRAKQFEYTHEGASCER